MTNLQNIISFISILDEVMEEFGKRRVEKGNGRYIYPISISISISA